MYMETSYFMLQKYLPHLKYIYSIFYHQSFYHMVHTYVCVQSKSRILKYCNFNLGYSHFLQENFDKSNTCHFINIFLHQNFVLASYNIMVYIQLHMYRDIKLSNKQLYMYTKCTTLTYTWLHLCIIETNHLVAIIIIIKKFDQQQLHIITFIQYISTQQSSSKISHGKMIMTTVTWCS